MKAIIFDLDGTLWDVVDTAFESVNVVANKYSLDPISRETVVKAMGKTMPECAAIYMPTIEEEKRLSIMQEMLEYNVKRLSMIGGKCYPRLEETVRELQKKHLLGIVSNCGSGYIESFLSTSGLEQYFPYFIAASKEKISKGNAIRKMMDSMQVDKAVYVGDTSKDLEASNEAGIPFIHAKYGFEPGLGTQYAISKIEELPKLLEEKYIL